METVTINGTKIALIVRGKLNTNHDPDLMAQHADVILPDGSPIGFFGKGDGLSGSSGSIGIGMDGIVYDYNLFQVYRPYYVNLIQAKRYKVKSTVLIITVTHTEALLFKNFWIQIKSNPKGFSLLGDNCSTHASEAFISAGILIRGIPGLDTPNNLFKQIITFRKNAKSYSGYVGFKKKTGGGFDLVID